MGNIFRANEIVEMGIQIEKNGEAFYSALAGRTDNADAKKIFAFLAGEERKHIAVFKELLDTLAESRTHESYPGEYAEYLRDLAGSHIFGRRLNADAIAREIGADSEAIDYAVGFEKDSIVLYVGFKGVVPKDDHQVIDKLIAEEHEHLKKLIELKKQVDA
jgi:rubrerythrin